MVGAKAGETLSLKMSRIVPVSHGNGKVAATFMFEANACASIEFHEFPVRGAGSKEATGNSTPTGIVDSC